MIPSENGTDKKTPSASLEDFSLILDLGDGDVVSSDSAEVSPAGGDGEEVPGTVQSPAEGGPVSSEGGPGSGRGGAALRAGFGAGRSTGSFSGARGIGRVRL